MLVVVAVDKYWALAEGQVGLFATDGRLPVIGQRKIETPAAAKNKETSCAYDQDGRQPLSRATHQLRLFHDVYGWPPLLFSARRPVCRAPMT